MNKLIKVILNEFINLQSRPCFHINKFLPYNNVEMWYDLYSLYNLNYIDIQIQCSQILSSIYK